MVFYVSWKKKEKEIPMYKYRHSMIIIVKIGQQVLRSNHFSW